jgi:hypothetical protein
VYINLGHLYIGKCGRVSNVVATQGVSNLAVLRVTNISDFWNLPPADRKSELFLIH